MTNNDDSSKVTGNRRSATSRTAGRTTARAKHNTASNAASAHPSRGATRFADRKRRRKRVLTAIYAAVAIELIVLLLASPLFAIRHVSIHGIPAGADILPAEENELKASLVMSAGCNWIVAPIKSATHRAGLLPIVRNVVISRSLPLDLTATVELRKPFYALATPAGSFEMDAENHAIRVLREQSKSRLKMVISSLSDPIKPGSNVQDDSVRTVSKLLTETRTDPVVHIAKIEIDQTHNICLNMDNGVRIKFGNFQESDAKLAMLRKLLTADPGRGIRFAEINVSSPDWPAGRLRDSRESGGPSSVASAASTVHTSQITVPEVNANARQPAATIDR